MKKNSNSGENPQNLESNPSNQVKSASNLGYLWTSLDNIQFEVEGSEMDLKLSDISSGIRDFPQKSTDEVKGFVANCDMYYELASTCSSYSPDAQIFDNIAEGRVNLCRTPFSKNLNFYTVNAQSETVTPKHDMSKERGIQINATITECDISVKSKDPTICVNVYTIFLSEVVENFKNRSQKLFYKKKRNLRRFPAMSLYEN